MIRAASMYSFCFTWMILGAHDPRIFDPKHDGEREHDVAEGRTQDRRDGEREDQFGDRQEDVDEAHQDLVEPATHEAREAADDAADHDSGADNDDRQLQRQPRAPDHAVEDVASLVGGAERMSRRAGRHSHRRPVARHLVGVGHVRGGDPGREDRHAEHRDDDDEAKDRGRVRQHSRREVARPPQPHIRGRTPATWRPVCSAG